MQRLHSAVIWNHSQAQAEYSLVNLIALSATDENVALSALKYGKMQIPSGPGYDGMLYTIEI